MITNHNIYIGASQQMHMDVSIKIRENGGIN